MATLTCPDSGVVWDVTDFDSAGLFEWGGCWAVKASGSVTIDRADITPAAGADGLTHGMMHNPRTATGWGFDSRIGGYIAGNNITGTVEVSAGDSLVLAVSNPAPVEAHVVAYSVLIILAIAPPEHAICPPAFGYDGSVPRPMHVIDCDTIAATLPEYDTTGHDQNDAPATSIAYARLFQPAFFAVPYENTRRWHGASLSGYGRDQAHRTSALMHHLIADQATAAEKADILGALMTNACMWHYGFLNVSGVVPNAEGAWNQGYFAPVKLFLNLLGGSTDVSYASCERDQPLIVTQAVLDALQPHNSSTLPQVSRNRTVTGVDGLTVTVTGVPSGNTSNDDIMFPGCLMVRNNSGDDGSVTAYILSGGSPQPINTDMTLTLETSNPFQVDDIVYCRDRQGFAINGADEKGVTWGTRGLDNWYSPSPSARYNQLQVWSNLLYLVAIDAEYIDAQVEPALRYMRMAQKSNTPAWDDHPGMQFTLPSRFVGNDFYSAHGEAIIATALAVLRPRINPSAAQIVVAVA